MKSLWPCASSVQVQKEIKYQESWIQKEKEAKVMFSDYAHLRHHIIPCVGRWYKEEHRAVPGMFQHRTSWGWVFGPGFWKGNSWRKIWVYMRCQQGGTIKGDSAPPSWKSCNSAQLLKHRGAWYPPMLSWAKRSRIPCLEKPHWRGELSGFLPVGPWRSFRRAGQPLEMGLRLQGPLRESMYYALNLPISISVGESKMKKASEV